jgi:hypothetical protein
MREEEVREERQIGKSVHRCQRMKQNAEAAEHERKEGSHESAEQRNRNT